MVPLIGLADILAFKFATVTMLAAVAVPQALVLDTVTVPPLVVTTEPVLEVFDQEYGSLPPVTVKVAVSLGQIVVELDVKFKIGRVFEKTAVEAVATPQEFDTVTVTTPEVFTTVVLVKLPVLQE